jgi:hypothetical protein
MEKLMPLKTALLQTENVPPHKACILLTFLFINKIFSPQYPRFAPPFTSI